MAIQLDALLRGLNFADVPSKVLAQANLLPTLDGASLSGTANNYNPTGLDAVNVLRQPTTGPFTITGMATGFENRVLILMNISANFITLNHEDAASTDTNRFWFPNNENVQLEANASAMFRYDGGLNRWTLIATTGGVASPDELVKVSSTDTTAGFLDNKIDSTSGAITAAPPTPSTNQKLDLDVNAAGVPAIINNTTTGVTALDDFTFTPGSPNITVGAGRGVIADNHTDPNNPFLQTVEWPATPLTITAITLNTVSYLYVTNTGTMGQQTTFPTQQEQRENIFIGAAVGDGVGVSIIETAPSVSPSPGQQLFDLMDAIGGIRNGCHITPNGSNLQINNSGGRLTIRGLNWGATAAKRADPNGVMVAAATPQMFNYFIRTGGPTSTGQTDIDVGNYDDGSPAPVGIPGGGNRATNHRVFITPTGTTAIQYGQQWYNSLAAAEAAVDDETFVQNEILIGSIPAAIISARAGATDLSILSDARITNLGKFGEGIATVPQVPLEVTDSITTVNPTTTLRFAGATVTDNGGGEALVSITGGGGGDVQGPASSGDEQIAQFDGTTGKLIKNNIATIDAAANMTLPGGQLNVGSATSVLAPSSGRINMANTGADSSNKDCRISAINYDTSQPHGIMARWVAQSGFNQLRLGGGVGDQTSATEILMYAATNTGTLSDQVTIKANAAQTEIWGAGSVIATAKAGALEFPAGVQVGTSGSFTPAFDATTSPRSWSYSIQDGRYYLIGKICICRFYLQASSSTGIMAGNLQISGLPFTHVGGGDNWGFTFATYTGINSTNTLVMRGVNSQAKLDVRRIEHGTASTWAQAFALLDGDMSPAPFISGTYIYEVN